MPRIAQKELSVNVQIRMQIEGIVSANQREELFVYDPGWGPIHTDPDTGELAKFYDHILRNVKFTGGTQVWILIPRYKLESGSLFRVLPFNLCVFKHYVVDEIQCVIDNATDELHQMPSKEDVIKSQLNASGNTLERPCPRTKWLWVLWFLKNLTRSEAILRMVQFTMATMSAAEEKKLTDILLEADYLGDLQESEPEDWLKIVIQSAWNTGRPLIPLRDTKSLREVWLWIQTTPEPNK